MSGIRRRHARHVTYLGNKLLRVASQQLAADVLASASGAAVARASRAHESVGRDRELQDDDIVRRVGLVAIVNVVDRRGDERREERNYGQWLTSPY